MCSIRSIVTRSIRFVAVALPAMLAAGGCQVGNKGETARLSEAPLAVDEAMQAREWDRTTAYYQSGDVVAGPTGEVFRPTETPLARVTDAPIALGNFTMMPVTFVLTPPWSKVVYGGTDTPSTHHARPVIPE